MEFRDGLRVLNFIAAKSTSSFDAASQKHSDEGQQQTCDQTQLEKSSMQRCQQRFCDSLTAQLSAYGIVHDVQAHIQMGQDNREQWVGVATMHSASEALCAFESLNGTQLAMPSFAGSSSSDDQTEEAADESLTLQVSLPGLATDPAANKLLLPETISDLKTLFLQTRGTRTISELQVLTRFRHCGELTCVRFDTGRLAQSGLLDATSNHSDTMTTRSDSRIATRVCEDGTTDADDDVADAPRDGNNARHQPPNTIADERHGFNATFELCFKRASAALRALEDLKGE
jgi:hypothetical protein